MPFKSKAQRRKFYAMLERGEIDAKTVREWESATKGKLPERVKKTASEDTMSTTCGAFERIFLNKRASTDRVELATRVSAFAHETAPLSKEAAAKVAAGNVTDEQLHAAFNKRASELTFAERTLYLFAPSDQFAQG